MPSGGHPLNLKSPATPSGGHPLNLVAALPYKHHSKYPFDNYRINVLQWVGHISMVIYIDPRLIIVNVLKIFANLYGYVTMYNSYKHHSIYNLIKPNKCFTVGGSYFNGIIC